MLYSNPIHTTFLGERALWLSVDRRVDGGGNVVGRCNFKVSTFGRPLPDGAATKQKSKFKTKADLGLGIGAFD